MKLAVYRDRLRPLTTINNSGDKFIFLITWNQKIIVSQPENRLHLKLGKHSDRRRKIKIIRGQQIKECRCDQERYKLQLSKQIPLHTCSIQLLTLHGPTAKFSRTPTGYLECESSPYLTQEIITAEIKQENRINAYHIGKLRNSTGIDYIGKYLMQPRHAWLFLSSSAHAVNTERYIFYGHCFQLNE